MKRKPSLSEADRLLFREAVSDVAPLQQNRIDPEPPAVPPTPRQRLEDERKVLRDMLSDSWDEAELETGEELLFARPGLQHSVLRKLRRGQYSVGAELDLHGMTVADARQTLAAFLHHCRERNLRVVRIIHGKGNRSPGKIPVLKAKVSHWLRQREEVLAFSSARNVDGGTGAVYVMLKRQ